MPPPRSPTRFPQSSLAARGSRVATSLHLLIDAFAVPLEPIRQLFRDLARGRGFPTCAMSGAGNSSSHAWASAPAFRPPQYTRTWDGPNSPVHSCDYAIAITVNGAPFSQTWWSMAGDAVTEFSTAAKTQLGTWDTRFDDDYAAWLAARLPVDPVVATR